MAADGGLGFQVVVGEARGGADMGRENWKASEICLFLLAQSWNHHVVEGVVWRGDGRQ